VELCFFLQCMECVAQFCFLGLSGPFCVVPFFGCYNRAVFFEVRCLPLSLLSTESSFRMS
jgi:hypothetical protein